MFIKDFKLTRNPYKVLEDRGRIRKRGGNTDVHTHIDALVLGLQAQQMN